MCHIPPSARRGAQSKCGVQQLPDAALIQKRFGCSLLGREIHSHSVRAGLGTSFTHLIREASLAGRAGRIVIQTVIRRCRDHTRSLAFDVDVGRVRSAPGKTRCIYSPDLFPPTGQRDRSRCRCCRWSCRWSWSWSYTPGWLLVEEGILLRRILNCYASVHPCWDVVVDQGRSVVVVARIAVHDPWVGLGGQRGDYVAERHVGEPGNTVVSGLASPHLVARNARVALLAVGTSTCVIPHCEQSVTRAD